MNITKIEVSYQGTMVTMKAYVATNNVGYVLYHGNVDCWNDIDHGNGQLHVSSWIGKSICTLLKDIRDLALMDTSNLYITTMSLVDDIVEAYRERGVTSVTPSETIDWLNANGICLGSSVLAEVRKGSAKALSYDIAPAKDFGVEVVQEEVVVPTSEELFTLEKYREMLLKHDWYYDFSDDIRVWRAGKKHEELLKHIAKQSPEHKKLWDELCK
jgi:hypothetical protein